uniref:Molybdopterin biosynthesis protein n=1 Tax=Dasyclonium flaccidum TaxID=2007274 RepID=A0A1Z1MKT5_9FLOR|nr:Molybdopterin biosynthesis protein [Dasyclonium flaccidum]ARW66710.1 Molybdopterin biosynthesis protein [Dasyclonium flaccidum]
MLNPKITLEDLNYEEYIYYTKHLILDSIGINGQKRLKQAKVLIVGAGGLGCPAMLYLIASGIGLIGIIDKDKIEKSNLNRQIIYSNNDIGIKKVILARKKLKELNPNCKIVTHEYNLNNKNNTEIIQYYDIILDTSDNFTTKNEIDKTCNKLNKVHIYGAIEKFEGQIGTFNYKNGIRYKDIYNLNRDLYNYSCNNDGIMGITAGYIGILQAVEAIKIILGIGSISNNHLTICHILSTEVKKRKIYKVKNTENRKNIKKIKTKSERILSQKKFKNLTKVLEQKILVIDIRQKNEFYKKHIKSSINIPLVHFKKSKTLKFIVKSSSNRTLFIYCNTIDRALIASSILNNYSLKHYIVDNK